MAIVLSEAIIEEIKARTDISALISSYGIQIRQAGSTLKACCPFHNEKTPSFVINTTRGFYHCFGCGESGDAIKFVMKMEGATFIEAATKLAQNCGIQLEEHENHEAGHRARLLALMAELAAFYNRCLLKTKEAQIARDYLKKRAIPESVQEDFLIGYAPNGITPILKWAEKYGYSIKELEDAGVIKGPQREGDKGYHRFSGRLMFSIKDKQGRVVAFSGRQLVEKKNSGKYVNSPETIIFKKSNVLFGFDRASAAIAKSPTREVICCEGQIDTIRLHMSGWTTAVASQGTAFTEEHAKMINRVADAAILMYDDDGAGRKATIKVAQLLLAREMPVRVVSLPGGHDPDSFLLTYGSDALKKEIEKAESIISFQCRVEKAKEAMPQSIDAVSRISKAVIATILSCPSPILRATLIDEAAHLLSLPIAALSEEVARVKASAPVLPIPQNEEKDDFEYFQEDGEEEVSDSPILGNRAEDVIPPPARELAFIEFLLANEYNDAINTMAGEFMPTNLFVHDFTIKFFEAWRVEVSCGEDCITSFAENLDSISRHWLDAAIVKAGQVEASGLSETDILKQFIRSLWCDWLKRQRGLLSVTGKSEDDFKRVKISLLLKRLEHAKWGDVKDIIRDLMKGDK